MALVLKDRVKVTTTTTGTGALTLGGAHFGYQDFSGFSNGDTTYYTIVDSATGAWEVGLGTYSSAGPTLTRTTVLASSTGGTVNFGAGPKDVFVSYPAGRAVTTDGAVFTGPITVPAGATGAQVPQAQETLLLAAGGVVEGETSLVKTLTSPDTTTLSSGSQTIDIGEVPSNVMEVDITDNSTLTITSSKVGAWMLLCLRITSGTVTWNNVVWHTPGGVAPTIGASRRFFLFYAQAASALIYGFTVGEPS